MSYTLHPRPEQIVDEIAVDASRLLALLTEATAVQYEPARRTAEDGPRIGQRGTVSRPTEDAALDPVRLRLREEVTASARLLVKTHRDLFLAGGRLERALEAWANLG